MRLRQDGTDCNAPHWITSNAKRVWHVEPMSLRPGSPNFMRSVVWRAGQSSRLARSAARPDTANMASKHVQ